MTVAGSIAPAAVEEARRALGRVLLKLARECEAAQTSEGRVPRPIGTRPSMTEEEAHRVTSTADPAHIVHQPRTE